ncbi:hypothetical protein L6452_21975 [Arctium lappa]|uniref:Uncharacterized protein n=1 Tax=Arctium lappa TaxID=4217 RepID=A0ACB9AXN8_ARCLA|nr:hypothetical protein L6452_21975 [Arctium lappa]
MSSHISSLPLLCLNPEYLLLSLNSNSPLRNEMERGLGFAGEGDGRGIVGEVKTGKMVSSSEEGSSPGKHETLTELQLTKLT